MRTRRLIACLVTVVCAVMAVCSVEAVAANEQPESERIITYFDSMEQYRAGKIDEALAGLRKALRVFQKSDFHKGVFMTHLALARILGNQAEYARALDELEKAEETATAERNLKWKALVLLRTGEVEAYRSRFDEADALFSESLEILNKIEEKHLSSLVKIRLARISLIRGKYRQAEALLNQAALPALKDGYLRDAADAFALQGRIQRLVDNYPKSIEFFDKALKIAQESHVPFVEQDVLVQKALTLASMGSLSDAERLLKIAAGFFNSVSDFRREAAAEAMLGRIMFQRGRIPEANTELEQSSREFTKLKDPFRKALVLVDRGRLLTVTGKLDEADKLLEEALQTFTQTQSPYNEMTARTTLTKLQVAQGRLLAAAKNASKARKLAEQVRSIRGQADATLAEALVFQALGDDGQAIAGFEQSLGLNRKLDCSTGQARCLIMEARSFVRMGYVDRARDNLRTLNKMPGMHESRWVHVESPFLAGLIAEAEGEEATARAEFKKAHAALSTLSEPMREALVLEAMAVNAARSRKLAKAFDLWDRTEEFYRAAPSPGGILRCRTAMVNLALDQNDVSKASSVIRKALRTRWSRNSHPVQPVHVAPLQADSPMSDRVSTRLASFVNPASHGPRFQLAQIYEYYQPNGQASGHKDDDPDAALLNAYYDALKARVALASQDFNDARRWLKRALEAAEKLQVPRASARFNLIMSQVCSEQGDHGQALEFLKKAGSTRRWRFKHIKAMALAKDGKIEEAISLLNGAMEDLVTTEVQEGVWQTSPVRMRERESLFQDYVDVLLDSTKGSVSQERAQRAWSVVQTLKLQRVFYGLASVGATDFPGVPTSLLKQMKSLQYSMVNARKRAAQLLPDKPRKKDEVDGLGHPVDNLSEEIKHLLEDDSVKFNQYVRLVKREAPHIDQLQARLRKSEAYVTFVVTRNRIYGFLIGPKVFKFSTVDNSIERIRKEIYSMGKSVERPYHLTIDRDMNGMWHQLFGAFAPEIHAVKTLIVEPDAFLTMFPFEALVPGEFPESYKEQQAAALLLDGVFVQRSTSAVRFLSQRDQNEATVSPSLEAYAHPDLPTSSGSLSRDSSVEHLLKYWKQPIAQFQSSHFFKGTQQGRDVTRIFGKKGRLLEGEAATVSEFLKRDHADHAMVHLLCPVLLPALPVGKVQQPLLVFSAEKGYPASGLCVLSEIMGEYDPTDLMTLTWLGSRDNDPARGLTLLIEALGYVGVRYMIVPLWETDRKGGQETDQFMVQLYRSIRAGDDPKTALTKARDTLKPTKSRKNRCNPARIVLF
jgi:tetratricopeptide (TPR) repeat protein